MNIRGRFELGAFFRRRIHLWSVMDLLEAVSVWREEYRIIFNEFVRNFIRLVLRFESLGIGGNAKEGRTKAHRQRTCRHAIFGRGGGKVEKTEKEGEGGPVNRRERIQRGNDF